MKTFVLIALSALPAALVAQVVLPSPAVSASPAPVSLSPDELRSEIEGPAWKFSAKRVPQPPAIDFKMRVVRPEPASDPRMPIARPDDRYDYQMLQGSPDAEIPPTRPQPRSRPVPGR